VQNLLFSSLLSKNIKIRIYRTIILPVLYACETWSLTLREEHRLRALMIYIPCVMFIIPYVVGTIFREDRNALGY